MKFKQEFIEAYVSLLLATSIRLFKLEFYNRL